MRSAEGGARFRRTEFARPGRRSSMADKPVLDLLARMTADSVEVSSLDPQSLMLVRIAA
jgi:hypothetical protein